MRYALVILFLHCKVFSQTITFSKAIDFNVGLEFPFSVIETDSGYVLMGGGQNFPVNDGWNGCVFIKTDFYGDTIHSNFYGKKTVGYYVGGPGSFIKVQKYGYAVGLSELDSVRDNLKAILIRYDERGDTIFLKRYGGSNDDRAYRVIETLDTGFALIGETSSFGEAFYLVKTDSAGNFEWQKTYVHSSDSKGISVALAHNGGYIMSGWGFTPGYNIDTYVAKADSVGNEQWKKRYGTRNEDGGAYIIQSSDGTYIVEGAIDTFNLTTVSGQKLWSTFIMKIDLNGEILWRYITNQNWYQQISQIREVAPGKGYIAVGQTYDEVFGTSYGYGWIIRLDNDGNVLWERKYAYPWDVSNHGLAPSALYDVQLTSDSGFICIGTTYNVYQDFWLLKLDSLGCMGDYCGLTDTNCYYKPYPNCEDDTVGVGGGASIEYQDLRLKVYPNPANDVVYFYPTSKYAAIEQVRIYDAQGRMVAEQQRTKSLNITHVAPGIYFYEVAVDDFMIPAMSKYPVRGKVIKQ